MHSLAHEETDDAQIEKKMNPIIPRVSGYISKVFVKDNDFVKKGDTLFTIDKRDYQLKIDEATAALLGAEGQYEAAKVLGYTSGQTFFRIVLPQVVKRIIPAMGNEVITLVKDTALVSVIGVAELLLVAKERQSALFSFVPLFIAGVFYFIMNWGVSVAFAKIEKKLSYYN
jgi:ABC-type arginine/histidine transport system permease subunit